MQVSSKNGKHKRARHHKAAPARQVLSLLYLNQEYHWVPVIRNRVQFRIIINIKRNAVNFYLLDQTNEFLGK
jgi:hypothetical protein